MRLALVAALALSTVATGALAQRGRPSTTAMSCGQAASLVARSGAIVLATGQNTYDRYVAGQNFCPSGYWVRPAFVPTRDNPQCGIGYYCSSIDPNPWR